MNASTPPAIIPWTTSETMVLLIRKAGNLEPAVGPCERWGCFAFVILQSPPTSCRSATTCSKRPALRIELGVIGRRHQRALTQASAVAGAAPEMRKAAGSLCSAKVPAKGKDVERRLYSSDGQANAIRIEA